MPIWGSDAASTATPTATERADLETLAVVLARLRGEVDEAIGGAVLEPGVWSSPARDACAARVDELRAALGTLQGLLDDAAEGARARIGALDSLGALG
ncbi:MULTISPECIES: hypothetical protein [unclassified Leifsonia]|uniref:hypothetical protein n=1 Tax=unclassified Leifsonia TaxID=2663824 RepID=UPI0012FA9C35|nr:MULTISPECIES: hypothetical protein [unclassified Leifsonia]